MFADLLRIKKIREGEANRAVKDAEAELEARQQAVRDAERAVEDYRAWRLAEEPRLFEEIKGRPVERAVIDRMKARVASLRERETRLEEAVEEVKQDIPPAEAAVRTAEAAHREAQRAVRKFEEFVEIQRQEEAAAAAFREDAELEETSEAVFAVRSRREQ